MIKTILCSAGYGSALIEHVLSKYDLLSVKLAELPQVDEGKHAKSNEGKKGKNKTAESFKRIFDFSTDLETLMNAINDANDIIKTSSSNKHKVNIFNPTKNTYTVLGSGMRTLKKRFGFVGSLLRKIKNSSDSLIALFFLSNKMVRLGVRSLLSKKSGFGGTVRFRDIFDPSPCLNLSVQK